VSDERARLFVALELPDAVREGLQRWRDLALSDPTGLRLTPPEFLHATLCFLGWRPVIETDAIRVACSVVAEHPAPQLALGRPIWLPRRRPRVLTVELEDAGQGLARLQSSLSEALEAGGWYQPEKRPYLPHVTVARVSGSGRAEPARLVRDLRPPAPLSFRASTVTLYRSRLLRGGARYEPLGSIELTG
jgi:RNA 2',3'-cyclic 3'-phosphodiesterase